MCLYDRFMQRATSYSACIKSRNPFVATIGLVDADILMVGYCPPRANTVLHLVYQSRVDNLRSVLEKDSDRLAFAWLIKKRPRFAYSIGQAGKLWREYLLIEIALRQPKYVVLWGVDLVNCLFQSHYDNINEIRHTRFELASFPNVVFVVTHDIDQVAAVDDQHPLFHYWEFDHLAVVKDLPNYFHRVVEVPL